jgi:PAS domain S-box-containing protein
MLGGYIIMFSAYRARRLGCQDVTMGRTFDKGVLVGIGLVVALLVVNAGLAYWNTRQLFENAGWVSHTHEVLDLTDGVLRTLVDAETGQRGFLITGKDRFLEPYHQALARLDQQVQALKDKTQDNPRQQARIQELDKLTGEQLALLQEGIDLRRQSAEKAQGFVATGEGKEKMDAIRRLIVTMEEDEHDLLRDREQRSSSGYRIAVATQLSATALGLGLIGALVYLMWRRLKERIRATARMHEQRERLHTTLTSIGDAVIVTDAEGRVTLMNRVAQAMTGWKTEADDKPLAEVFRIVNEQTRQPVESPVTKVIREGVVVGLANHTALIAKDGTEVPIDDSGAPIRNAEGEIIGVVLVFRDVTERRRLERLQRDLQGQLERQVQERTAELRLSEERFRLLVEGTQDYAIFMLDAEGRVVSWNPGAERIKGYRADEIIGQHFGRFYSSEDVQSGKPERELKLAADKGRCEDEGWRVRKDGSRFWASVIITALHDGVGKLRGFSKITRDITERRLAQEKLEQANAELERRVEERTAALHGERELLRVTLASIGDAVITTDLEGRVTFLNPVAESLTGWGQELAQGQPLEAVFPIVHEQTRQPVENPVAKVLREGVVIGLGNHTVLFARDGNERPIDDSAAPIKDGQGITVGVVLVFRDVTEQRQAQLAQRESEARNTAILETALDCVITIDHEGRVVEFNRAAERIFGYSRAHVMGRDLADLIIPSSLRERHRHGLTHYLATGEGPMLNKRLEMQALRADGTEFPVELAITRISAEGPALFTAYLRDITGQRRAERTARFLADASATLAALVDDESTLQKVARLAVPFFADWCTVDMAQPDGSLRRVAVAHVDPSKVELALELNRRYPPDPDAPQGAPYILRTGQSEIVCEITDSLLAEKVQNEELLRILRALGLKSYLGVPLQARGKTLGVITFLAADSGRRYDSTDLAVAEDLAHRAGIAIENGHLFNEVREADRRKDEFLAMLAHELRNPLAPIRNALHIMKQPGTDGAVMERVRELMERQVQHMTRMVDDLLDVSRITRGKIELRKEVVDLASVVSRTVEAIRPFIEDRHQELTVDLPSEPVRLEVDPTRLEQVLANLLNNAAKYTDQGGHLWLSARQEGGELVLRVKDTGMGILPDMLVRIFEPFVQSDRVLHHSQGGLGIGLTLVQSLVEMHGGTVTAHSDGLGKGSEFVVHLPALSNEQQTAGKKAAGRRSKPAGATLQRRILVVDDNVDAAESLAMLLLLEGHDVRVAHDGSAALAAVDADVPDIVFLDIGMPVMNGYEVAQQLRQRPGLERLLLVAMTGWGQEEDRRRSLEAGFNHHLVKPADPEALQKLLDLTQ